MKSLHHICALGVALALAAGAAPAFAQNSTFAKRGKLTVGAERLTGVFVNDGSTDLDGTATAGPFQGAINYESDDSTTIITFLGSGLEAGPHGVPRVGVDYFVIDSLSVGGSISYASNSNKSEQQTTGAVTFTQEVEETTTLFSLTPRAGYGMMFTNLIGLWARGGFTYTKYSIETDVAQPGEAPEQDEIDASLFSLSADAQLILSPIDHVAFGVGPQFDVALTGSAETSNTAVNTTLDGDVNLFTFGVSAGLLVWF